MADPWSESTGIGAGVGAAAQAVVAGVSAADYCAQVCAAEAADPNTNKGGLSPTEIQALCLAQCTANPALYGYNAQTQSGTGYGGQAQANAAAVAAAGCSLQNIPACVAQLAQGFRALGVYMLAGAVILLGVWLWAQPD